jgi:hypothetical protein
MTKGAWIGVGIGAVIVLVGVVLGLFTEVTLPNGVGCGAAWSGDDTALLFRDYKELCSDARSSKGLVAAVVAGVGALVVTVSVLIGFLAPRRNVTSPSGS